MLVGAKKRWIKLGLFCSSLLFSGCSNSFDTKDTTLNSSVEMESTELGISEHDLMLKESTDKPENIESESAIFDIEWYNIRFTMTDDWIKLDKPNYDLRFKKNDGIQLFINAYQDIDLAEEETLLSKFDMENRKILDNFEKVKQIEELDLIHMDDKVIWTEMYSFENEGNKIYSYHALIEFNEPADSFAWFMALSVPSVMEKYRDELDTILKTSEYIGDREG